MKKLKNILIVFFSLLLLVVTLYLLVEAPFTTEGLESYHIKEWKIMGSGVEMISSAVFYP
jgi:hypothetical protein